MGFIRLLLYGRILSPASKIETTKQNNHYYSEIVKDMYEYNIYDTLSFLYDYRSNIINWVNRRLIDKFNRKTDIIFYDVTNFFFEIDEPDEDEESLRKWEYLKNKERNLLFKWDCLWIILVFLFLLKHSLGIL